MGRSSLVEIQVLLDEGVLRVVTLRNSAYASNSHIFFMWMLGTSLVLLGVAVAFLRNQIRPILRLATAAEDFGPASMAMLGNSAFAVGNAREQERVLSSHGKTYKAKVDWRGPRITESTAWALD